MYKINAYIKDMLLNYFIIRLKVLKFVTSSSHFSSSLISFSYIIAESGNKNCSSLFFVGILVFWKFSLTCGVSNVVGGKMLL